MRVPALQRALQAGAEHTPPLFPAGAWLTQPGARFLLEAVGGPRRAATSWGQKGLSCPRHDFISSGP